MLDNPVDQRIAQSICAYPTLFGCRTKVLEFWFCVIGNGTEWVDGELQGEPFREETLEEKIQFSTSWIQDRMDDPHTKNTADLQARWRMMLLETSNQIRFRVENAHTLALVPWGVLRDSPRGRIYPMCSYSRMAQVPSNVKPEWLAAVREMILEVFAYEPELEDTEEHERNLVFADQILQSLAKRFGAGNCPSSLQEWKDRREATWQELKQMLQNTKGHEHASEQ